MKSKWLPVALGVLFPCSAEAAEIVVVPTRELAFGAFVAGPGKVVIPAVGARTRIGSVILLSSDGGSMAQFSVTGDDGTTFAISLPADGMVFLDNGSSNMPVNKFTSNPSATGSISGTRMISVGATLDVAAGQATGSYSGNFTVIVDYN